MPYTLFSTYWDNLIDGWMKNPSILSPLIPQGSALSTNHLPEPYYGDMDNCSIVIVNMNPGAGLCGQCWHRQNDVGTEVHEAKTKKYSGYAQPFHYLDRVYPYVGGEGARWWNSRKDWIKRVLDDRNVHTDLRPFAIELCPLHSPRFDIKDPAQYVKDLKVQGADIVACMEYAIRHSEAQLGLAVGKKIHDVMTDPGIGFKSVHCWSPTVGTSNKTRRREYDLIEKGDVKILCTWAPGSNHAPSVSFSKEEAIILSSI